MHSYNTSVLDEVSQYYLHINMQVEHSMMQFWLDLDLSFPQIRVLYILSLEGLMSISRLAEKLDTGLSAASHLVDRLERSGYVVRTLDERDRRRTLVNLTPQGSFNILNLRQHAQDRFRALADQLATEDLQSLQRGLQALMRISGKTGTSNTLTE